MAKEKSLWNSSVAFIEIEHSALYLSWYGDKIYMHEDKNLLLKLILIIICLYDCMASYIMVY